jgi:hypothetical protein
VPCDSEPTPEHPWGGALPDLAATPLDASDAELAAFREAISSMEMDWGQALEGLAGFLSTAR